MFGVDACPCGSGALYDACCGRFHRGAEQASTAEELMRSRYAAYAVDDLDYVFRTWHPRTRPADPKPQPGTTWTGLEIVDVVAGGPDDDSGIVEFRAHFTTPSGVDVLHERSTFERRAGRWFYLTAV
ncbi:MULTISPECIES: YchJ family protein [unclassified Nocardioides]|uniref:YchJ family protein n=1 Tax=unclassified Nocardioides TaxID=2615069 RepID=UPI0006FDF2A5|nr:MULTISPECIES: YchJ family metal-binding protein [unclassified Nocardioides]KQY64711.1 zinc chelation protein SecC [Nocardioides sp. Root140]KRF12613.1 zinc chelation protein SecC [Nocardioides sp. Soil796]